MAARVCLDCPAPISRLSTGRCRACANRRSAADPAIVAKRTEGLKRRMRGDVVLRTQHAQRSQERLAAWRATPEGRDKLLSMGRTGLAKAHAPEARRKCGAARTANALAWCPPAYRDEYRRLTRRRNFRAAEARAIVERQILADARREIAANHSRQTAIAARERSQAY